VAKPKKFCHGSSLLRSCLSHDSLKQTLFNSVLLSLEINEWFKKVAYLIQEIEMDDHKMVHYKIIAKSGYTLKVWMTGKGDRGALMDRSLVWFGSQETEDKHCLVHKRREEKIWII